MLFSNSGQIHAGKISHVQWVQVGHVLDGKWVLFPSGSLYCSWHGTAHNKTGKGRSRVVGAHRNGIDFAGCDWRLLLLFGRYSFRVMPMTTASGRRGMFHGMVSFFVQSRYTRSRVHLARMPKGIVSSTHKFHPLLFDELTKRIPESQSSLSQPIASFSFHGGRHFQGFQLRRRWLGLFVIILLLLLLLFSHLLLSFHVRFHGFGFTGATQKDGSTPRVPCHNGRQYDLGQSSVHVIRHDTAAQIVNFDVRFVSLFGDGFVSGLVIANAGL
mmetsp:Transcript_9544/g.16704  ORF Transcript_9544/g.16704 Transcript_9544/m.16704 type:complete len:271 (+) Transcript_9544:720-1532(+)